MATYQSVTRNEPRLNTMLVTGGAGFIGSNFVQLAIESGYRVVNLDALTYAGNLASLAAISDGAAHIFVHGSIADRPLVADLLAKYQPSFILNLAAESHVDRSIDEPDAFIHTNVIGTFELLEAAKAYWDALAGEAKERFRFLQVSTDEVYGSIPDGQFDETSAYAPNSPYAASKASANHLARAYNRTYGLPTMITNCGNNYGPKQFPEKLIPLMVITALEEKPLPVYADGQNVRDWLYVGDHCHALLRVLEAGHPGETYNIGGSDERTNLTVVQHLCALLDELSPRGSGACHAELITFVPDRPGHDRRYAIDPGKVERELGWRPHVDFAAGLRSTVKWYLDNRRWWQGILRVVYQGKRLGLGKGRKVS